VKVTQITVSYGATQSLPEYSNVKPQLTLTATLDEGENSAQAEQILWAYVRASVHEQIDRALEASGRAAKYSDEPRYQVLRTYWNEWDHRGQSKPPQYVIILPNEISLNEKAYNQRLIHTGYGNESRKLRYTHALAVAQEAIQHNDDNPVLLDCSNGDLTPLNEALSVPERDLIAEQRPGEGAAEEPV
jgi:hypothetical protein